MEGVILKMLSLFNSATQIRDREFFIEKIGPMRKNAVNMKRKTYFLLKNSLLCELQKLIILTKTS